MKRFTAPTGSLFRQGCRWLALALVLPLLWASGPAEAGGGTPQQSNAIPSQMASPLNGGLSTRPPSTNEGAWISIEQFQRLQEQHKRQRGARWIRLGEARYSAVYTSNGFDVKASMEIEVKGKGWHRVGILPKAYPLHEARIKGKPAWLLAGPAGGLRQLVIRGEGRHTLKLHFFLPQLDGPEPRAQFHLAPAHASHLKISFVGKGYRPKLRGGLRARIVHTAKLTTLHAMVSPEQKPILSWWVASHEQVKSTQQASRIARLYARTYALLSAGQGGQELFLTVRYTIVHAPREQFRLLIPKGIHIRQVHGLGMRDYRLVPDPQGRGQILDVLLTEPVTERYEISLLAEHREDKGEIVLQLPEPIGVQRETGYLGVEVIDNAALKIIAKGASTIDVQELPPEIIKGTQKPILRAYRFTRRPASWKLNVRKHTNVSVPAAMIDQALYLQVANHEGQTWVQATYQVRNTFKQFIAIKLPKDAQIQSAFVGGKAVKPAKDKQDRVLIPLKRSGKASGHAFPVEVVYNLKQSPFIGRSRHKAALPQVDLWIADLQWWLYLPRGHVNWDPSQLGIERPQGYSSWNFNSASTVTSRSSGRRRRHRGFSGKWQNQRAPAQVARTSISGNTITMQSDGKTAGALPVRIQLPRRGRLYRFNRYHLAPQSPTQLTYRYQPPQTSTFGLALFLLGGLLLGFACTRLALLQRWDLFLPWLMILASGACISAGIYYATLIHLTIIVGGSFGGLLIAAAIHFFQSLDQPRPARAPTKEPTTDTNQPTQTQTPEIDNKGEAKASETSGDSDDSHEADTSASDTDEKDDTDKPPA